MQTLNLSSASHQKLVSTLEPLIRESFLDREQLLSLIIYTAAVYEPTLESAEDVFVHGFSAHSAFIRWVNNTPARSKFFDSFEDGFFDETPDEMVNLISEMKHPISDHGYYGTLVAMAQILLASHDDPVGVHIRENKKKSYLTQQVFEAVIELLDFQKDESLKIQSTETDVSPSVIGALNSNIELDLHISNWAENSAIWRFLAVLFTDSESSIKSSFSDMMADEFCENYDWDTQVLKKSGRNLVSEWHDAGRKFLLLPPFNHPATGKKKRFVHTDWLESVTKRIKAGQSYCIHLPASFLSSTKPHEVSLRQQMVEKKLLKNVIQLPPSMSTGHSIPSCLLILEGSQENDALFVDASDCCRPRENGKSRVIFDTQLFSGLLNSSEDPRKSIGIKVQNWEAEEYSLAVAIHFAPPAMPTKPGTELFQLADIVTGLVVGNDKLTGEFLVLSTKDLNGLETLAPTLSTEASQRTSRKTLNARYYKELYYDSLVVSDIFSKQLKASHFESAEAHPERIYMNSSLHTFTIKSEMVRADWLLHALDTDWAREHLRRRTTGLTIPRIRMRDLLSIPILLPSLEQQAEEIKEIKRERFDLLALKAGLESQLQESKSREQLYLRAKTHTIAQQYNGLKSDISVLRKIIQRTGQLDASATPIPENPTTVGDLTDFIYSSCLELGEMIEHLDKQSLSQPKKDFVLNDVVEDWIKQHQYPGLDILSSGLGTGVFWDEEGSDPIRFSGSSPADLSVILTNLVENARRHGFPGASMKQPKVEISLSYDSTDDEGPFAILRVANNGVPLPDSFTLSHFTAPRIATGATGNSGMGGWIIQELVSNAGAELIIVDPEFLEDDFTTAFEIKFYLA